MAVSDDARLVNAEPSKELFISMLVKDIPLISAIVDLVDNSVDGARRLRGSGSYEGLRISIRLSRDGFRITDNCGGIPVPVARDYAFRFGRPSEVEPTPRSLGQFGVGMKRAIFKMGTAFRVESTTANSRFVIEEDVMAWRSKREWTFQFKELEYPSEREYPADQQGTTLEITSLHEIIAEEFESETFRSRVAIEVENAHQDAIDKGLIVTVNGVPLKTHIASLLQSDDLTPAFLEFGLPEQSEPPRLMVRIYAGIAPSDPRTAGWYVFCNGRMLLEADKTPTTGWGEKEGSSIPRYHNQYARFRGYVFLDSDDASFMPWNTTKTRIDEDSQAFKAIRLRMIEAMRPVIRFLDELDAETERAEAHLRRIVEAAREAPVGKIAHAPRFKSPELPPANPVSRISYTKPREEVERVKKSLGVSQNKEVGERTFEYYLSAECDD